MGTRMTAAIVAALMAISLGACDAGINKGGSEPGPTLGGSETGDGVDGTAGRLPFHGSDGWEFQKNMGKSAFGSMKDLCKSETGYYFQFDSCLYYLEGSTGRVTPLCARPDCSHDDKSCDAYAGAYAVWYSGGRLYFAKRDFEEIGGSFTELGKRVYSVNPDGTGRRQVMSLELQPLDGRPLSSFDEPICHRGTVYFVYNGVLYAAPLEGDTAKAERIFGEEYFSGGGTGAYTAYDPGEPHYTLWADGDNVYFMLNVTDESGARRDALYAYDTVGKSVARVWEVPGEDEVGRWETTGVEVTQWYVLNGAIYFYLSGGDYWRTDLATGETVKLADTGDKTLYGTAVFSDEYMCLINDHPMTDPVTGEYWLGAGLREGGDTVFVYRLDGTFIRQLSLTGLWDTLGEISGFYPVFCDEAVLYLIADAGQMVPTDFGSQKSRCDVLCRLDLETGEITETARWEDRT